MCFKKICQSRAWELAALLSPVCDPPKDADVAPEYDLTRHRKSYPESDLPPQVVMG